MEEMEKEVVEEVVDEVKEVEGDQWCVQCCPPATPPAALAPSHQHQSAQVHQRALRLNTRPVWPVTGERKLNTLY